VRVVVTGGAGFIGSHIVDALVARGDEVTVIDNLTRGRREQVNPKANLIVADVTDPNLTIEFARIKPEVVIHEAAQIDVRRSVREPLYDTDVNVVGTVNTLQAAADAGARRFIFASSGGAIYGDTDALPAPESTECQPSSHYGAAKECGEIYGRVYSRLYGISFTALRYANVYGPRQDPHGEAGVVAIFAQKLLAGEVPVINGDGKQTRDYVHVSDVVAANVAALDGPAGAYNIATGVESDVNDIYRLISASCNSDAEPLHGPAKPGEQLRSCLECTFAAKELNWTAKWGLSDGIADTVGYFRNQS
jgi:UDP-glucose 4-epimerase